RQRPVDVRDDVVGVGRAGGGNRVVPHRRRGDRGGGQENRVIKIAGRVPVDEAGVGSGQCGVGGAIRPTLVCSPDGQSGGDDGQLHRGLRRGVVHGVVG